MHPGTYIVQNHTKIVCMNDKNIRSHPILMEAVHLERKTPSIHHFFKRVFISPGRKPTLFLSPNCNHQKKYRQKKRCFTKIRNTFIIRVTRANRDIRNKVEIATVWARYGSVTLQPTQVASFHPERCAIGNIGKPGHLWSLLHLHSKQIKKID